MALPQFPYRLQRVRRGPAGPWLRRFYIVRSEPCSEHELYQVYLFGIFLAGSDTCRLKAIKINIRVRIVAETLRH